MTYDSENVITDDAYTLASIRWDLRIGLEPYTNNIWSGKSDAFCFLQEREILFAK